MLDGIPLVNLTPSVLVGIVVLMILLGRLRTNKEYQEKCAESERWRNAYEVERDARVLADRQTAELLELAKATHDILHAALSEVEPPGRGGVHRVVQKSSR